MERHIEFDYFYGKESESLSFYRVPKLLFTDPLFRELSSDAKILYGLMLDRMTLSLKNGWFDSDGRAYIYFAVEDIMEMLNCGRNKAIKSIQELDVDGGIGLIEKKRQGQGKATVIYVKNFVIEEVQKFENETSETEKTQPESDPEVYNSNFKKFKKQTSRSPENKLLEVYISNSNYNKYNNTDSSETESNPIQSAEDGSDEMRDYEQLVKENISYDVLLASHPNDEDILSGIVDLMLEVLLCKGDSYVISSSRYPLELVKSKFLKLNYGHIEYVLSCLQSNTTKVKNIKKYLLAALFNAPSTMAGYYRAEVNHDFPQYATGTV
jgi:hypothetical protein